MSSKKSTSNTNQYTNQQPKLIHDGPFIYTIYFDEIGDVDIVTRDFNDTRPTTIVPEEEYPDKVKAEIENNTLGL